MSNGPTTEELIAGAHRAVQHAAGLLADVETRQNKLSELEGLIDEQRHTIQTLHAEADSQALAITQLRTQKDNQRRIILSYIESHKKIDNLLQDIQSDSSVHDILIAMGKVLEVVRMEELDGTPDHIPGRY